MGRPDPGLDAPRRLGVSPAPIALLSLLGLALAIVSLGGCPRPTAPVRPRLSEAPPVTRKAESSAHERRSAILEALRNLQTIPELWNAQNQAQDRLGQALAQLPVPIRHRVQGDPPARLGPQGHQPGAVPPVPTHAPAHRWSDRDDDTGLCREACRHVAAICYAARRICAIASRLGDWAARQACSRAGERCQEAQRAARARCTRCSVP